MDDLVVSPLCKSGVNIAERLHTLGGEARSKGYGMLLGDIRFIVGSP